jgi:hypothetical protein
MKRILEASLLWSVNVCLLIEVLHTPGIYNLAKRNFVMILIVFQQVRAEPTSFNVKQVKNVSPKH